MFRKIVFIALLSFLALYVMPAMAKTVPPKPTAAPDTSNRLFPPSNVQGNGDACPTGEVLTWTGKGVACTKGYSTSQGCPLGTYATGVSNGKTVCMTSIQGCTNPTVGRGVWTLYPQVIIDSSSSLGLAATPLGFGLGGSKKTTTTVILRKKDFLGWAVNCTNKPPDGAYGDEVSRGTSNEDTTSIPGTIKTF
ncbi:MAG: hypothetical protein WC612_00155 [Bdellovibrionales bacterium]|jgi:hypothetical protein